MIRTIVFDMGDVLIRFSPVALAEREGVIPEELDLFVREVFCGKEWISLDRGTMQESDAVASVCRRLPEHLHKPAEAVICRWWRWPLTPVPGMAELVGELKKLGYGIYLLSNAPSNLHTYFPRIPGHEFFDGEIVSGDWKMLKPHRDIFELLYRTYDLDPAKCLFIDDVPANIDGAAQTGMEGVVFLGDVPRLRRELNALGIPVYQ